MSDLLRPVKTIKKKQSNVERFETLSLKDHQHGSSRKSILELVTSEDNPSTPSIVSEPERLPLVEIHQSQPHPPPASNHKRHNKHDSTAFLQQIYLQKEAPNSLPDDAREVLKCQPDDEDLLAVLKYLQYGIESQHDFSLRIASPKAAQIIHVLVTLTIPDHWTYLCLPKLSSEQKQIKAMLLLCLTSAAGIGALLTQIRKRSFLNATETANQGITEAVSVLAQILSPLTVVSTLLREMVALKDKPAQRQAIWQELCSLLGGSKVLASVAQASATFLKKQSENFGGDWLADGTKYSAWLANRITTAAAQMKPNDAESQVMLSQLFRRGMNLGYRDHFVSETYSSLLMGTKALWTPLHLIIQPLPATEQISFFEAMLRDLARKYLSTNTVTNGVMASGIERQNCIGGVAAIVKGVISGNTVLEDYLVEWLTKSNGDQATLGLDTRRAVIATLALREEKLQTVLNKCLENFSDKIAIQHTPVLQQDALAQIILLSVGYLNQKDSKLTKQLSRSSLYLQSVSNRLAASVPRARVLGMIVGVAVSKLVDDASNIMKFEIEEMETEEVKAMINLVEVRDTVGDVTMLKMQSRSSGSLDASKPSKFTKQPSNPRHPRRTNPPVSSRIISIEEVETDSDDEDGLVPYRKPEDDASDSEDDPTLINRAKPKAPVYIIDLIKYLQLSDKPDVVEMALQNAPQLIRRKINFGTELSENINALAAALLNLQDGMSKEEGHQLRMESMIACLVALPSTMGPWLAAMYFEGDFSLSQRASLLSTIGLGTRELAGYKDDAKLGSTASPFPSQRLPSHLAALYAPMDAVAMQLEHATLQPMALAAADKVTGPDILKVRTFSSRMQVEKKAAQRAKERQTKIPKDLHKLLAESFYLPLCSRMTLLLSSAHANLQHSTISEPHIMRLFLQTLTILLTNLGPNALQLPTVTRETLNLLLALHHLSTLSLDPAVLPALLHLLLTTLQLNTDAGAVAEEQLVTDFGTAVAELVGWAGAIGDAASIPTADDGADGTMPWTVLAAACQVRWHEVGRKFQGRMMGLGLLGSDFDDF